ncbi:ATP-binding cassette domain-containing protein [Clostridium sp. SGI.024]|uniref:ATP-binding cassette domain-containing protein n=1 Tax=Clostridium sp. SGI.024 TaxID=3420551 RepID=UPI003CFF56B6
MSIYKKDDFLIEIFKKKFKIFIIIFVLYLSIQLQNVISTFFMGKMVDQIAASNYSLAIKLILASSLSILLINFLYYIYNILFKIYSSKISYEIKNKIYNILLDKKLIYLKKYSPSYIVDRINKDSSICSEFFLNLKPSFYINILNVIIMSAIIISINPLSLLIIIILIILNVIVYSISYKKIYKREIESMESVNSQFNIEINWFDKLNLVKRENIFSLMLNDIEENFNFLLKKISKSAKTNSNYSFLGGLVNILSTVLLMTFFLYQIIDNKLTVGNFIIAFSYYGELSKNITSILSYGKNIQSYNVALDRINELINLSSEPNGNKILDTIDHISLRNINIQFPETKLLNNFSYEFNKGNIYLITGPNGVGKSTLIDVILGLLDNYSGDIYINSINKKDLDMKFLRTNKISYASQETIILESSLEDNINLKFERPINNLFKLENLNNKQFNSASLSGGEKRKIILNRAISKNSDLLIFDEPDTFLDQDSLLEFKKYLKFECSNKIIIIISHNKDLINLSKNIIRL